VTRHIVLVGLMGTGKTTVGSILAQRLGCALVDSDLLVEARERRTVREIWLSDGEATYRVMETAALREGLAAQEPAVIAAAGGVVLSEENRRLLVDSGACVVWLQADVSVLLDRVRTQPHRPLLDDDPEGTLRRMMDERSALYDEVSVHAVDALAPPDIVADRVMEACGC
jgi:shikimate kinase